MITSTTTEFWVAVVFFLICFYTTLSNFNFEKMNLQPKLMRILYISLMVIGGYTFINGLTNLGFIGHMLDVWSGEGNIEKFASVKNGISLMVFFTVVLIVSILFGGLMLFKSLARYRRV